MADAPYWWCLTCGAWADLDSSSCVHLHRWTPRPDGKPPQRFRKRKEDTDGR